MNIEELNNRLTEAFETLEAIRDEINKGDEEKPKIGDLVILYNENYLGKFVGVLSDIDNSAIPFAVGVQWFECAVKYPDNISAEELKALLID